MTGSRLDGVSTAKPGGISAGWRKSTYSEGSGGRCVEVGTAAPGVMARDTTDRAGAVLSRLRWRMAGTAG